MKTWCQGIGSAGTDSLQSPILTVHSNYGINWWVGWLFGGRVVCFKLASINFVRDILMRLTESLLAVWFCLKMIALDEIINSSSNKTASLGELLLYWQRILSPCLSGDHWPVLLNCTMAYLWQASWLHWCAKAAALPLGSQLTFLHCSPQTWV